MVGVAYWVLLLVLGGGMHSMKASEGFVWVLKSGQQATLSENGTEVLTYQIAPQSKDGKLERSNYVHPLRDLEGVVLTEDFPEDHYHHRGIFWTWHQLLSNGESLADPWNCENIKWLPPQGDSDWVQTSVGPNGAVVRATHDWVIPDEKVVGRDRRVVRETIRIHAWPAALEHRVIDFDISLLALEGGISIGGSTDDKGYGGFSPRIRLADDVRFTGQIGPVEPDRLAVEGGAWMNVVGSFDDRTTGVAMMVHPSHPGYPLKWILREKRSMQNPQWPGREPVVLSTRQALRLRYSLVVHSGRETFESLESLWKEFSDR